MRADDGQISRKLRRFSIRSIRSDRRSIEACSRIGIGECDDIAADGVEADLDGGHTYLEVADIVAQSIDFAVDAAEIAQNQVVGAVFAHGRNIACFRHRR
jgi:hypothetical protein